MTGNLKLPRKLSEERKPPPPRRPSHASVIENLDRWANSPGLRPPALSDEKEAWTFLKPGSDQPPGEAHDAAERAVRE